MTRVSMGRKAVLVGVAALALSIPAPAVFGGDRDHDRDRDRPRDSDRDHRHRFEPFFTRQYVPHGREMHSLPLGCLALIVGGMEYYYWEGMFLRPREDRYVVVSAPVGAVVTGIPAGATTVVVEGVPYYQVNGVVYMHTSYGYQVVPQPNPPIFSDATPGVSNPPNPEAAAAARAAATGQPAASAPALPAALPATPAAVNSSTNSDDAFTVNIPNAKGGYTPVTLKRAGTGFTGPQGEYYTEFPRIEQLKVMYAK
jgi:hypothetical protein